MFKRFCNFTILLCATMAAFAATGTAFSEDWDNYVPAHEIGSADDEWWTVYPDQHENAGSAVDNLDWVLDDLKEKPVLMLVHSSNCVPCLSQMPRIQSAVDKFGDDLKYYDILAEGDGYAKALEVLDVYDPDGGGQYVPTTIFMTLAPGPDGNVEPVWHSQIDAIGQEAIDSYISDAIYYHKKNAGSWS